jgi:hypothetical protein
MRCEEVRERLNGLWEGEEGVDVGSHLARCPACTQYRRDLRWVRAGFQLWKHEDAPVPSLGFAERLVRQLGAMGNVPSLADFFERVGRRFVYAALVLTSLALLALALPATGPVRGLSAADIQIPTQEAALVYVDPMGDSAVPETTDAAPVQAQAPAVSNEGK